jgi:hypothetical protein
LLPQLEAVRQRDFFSGRDDGPPALPLLAVRAARRAVAANPQDAEGYVWLEQAYAVLHGNTRERAWREELPELVVLRHVQMVTALEHALTIQPDLTVAHLKLADLYGQFRGPQNPQWPYIDLQLKHLREGLAEFQRAGPQPQEKREDYDKHVKELDRQVNELQKTVQKHLNQFEVSSSSMRVLQKARKALSLGLAEQALNVLLESDVLEFGQQGAQLQFELLLSTGRVQEARQMLTDELKGNLGSTMVGPATAVSAYEWYSFLLAAADGDYADADKQLKELADEKDPWAVLRGRLQEVREMTKSKESDEVIIARMVGRVLMETPQEKPLGWLALNHLRRLEELQTLFSFTSERQQQAELLALRGLVALEAGKTAEAEGAFRQTLAISLPPARCAPYLSLLGARSPLEAAALVDPSQRAATGPLIDFRGRPMSLRYVHLMEKVAEGKE